MKHQRVTSRHLTSVAYDPNSSTLEIAFKSGATYRYQNVPAKVHEDLMKATSKGSFFDARIRMSYKYQKI